MDYSITRHWVPSMNVFILFVFVMVVMIVGSFLGISWLSYPRSGTAGSKPFNRTIHRSTS